MQQAQTATTATAGGDAWPNEEEAAQVQAAQAELQKKAQRKLRRQLADQRRRHEQVCQTKFLRCARATRCHGCIPHVATAVYRASLCLASLMRWGS